MIMNEVVTFSKAMAVKLQQKMPEHGDTWKSMDLSALISALEEHVKKAKERGQAKDWIDVANVAMFLYFRLGGGKVFVQ